MRVPRVVPVPNFDISGQSTWLWENCGVSVVYLQFEFAILCLQSELADLGVIPLTVRDHPTQKRNFQTKTSRVRQRLLVLLSALTTCIYTGGVGHLRNSGMPRKGASWRGVASCACWVLINLDRADISSWCMCTNVQGMSNFESTITNKLEEDLQMKFDEIVSSVIQGLTECELKRLGVRIIPPEFKSTTRWLEVAASGLSGFMIEDGWKRPDDFFKEYTAKESVFRRTSFSPIVVTLAMLCLKKNCFVIKANAAKATKAASTVRAVGECNLEFDEISEELAVFHKELDDSLERYCVFSTCNCAVAYDSSQINNRA